MEFKIQEEFSEKTELITFSVSSGSKTKSMEKILPRISDETKKMAETSAKFFFYGVCAVDSGSGRKFEDGLRYLETSQKMAEEKDQPYWEWVIFQYEVRVWSKELEAELEDD